MATLKNLVDETINIKNEIVECRDTLKQILIDKKIEDLENENKLSSLITKVSLIKSDNEYNNITYFYKNGNEYTDITGGWEFFDAWTGGGVFNDYAKNSDHLYISEIYDCIGFVCEKVDFTKYTTLFVDYEILTNTDNSTFSVVIKDAYPYTSTHLASAGAKKVGRGLIAFDISKVNGVHKLSVESYTGTTTNQKFEFKVYQVWASI